jgi:glyoxylase-like metal-dependent hydrolase (beta-lactamase superfamily II)
VSRALAAHDVLLLRADNPGPFTLSGTNTWVVGRDPAWVVDPGPELAEHVAAVAAAVDRRGGLGGVALTHDHADHAAGLEGLRERLGQAPVATSGRAGPLSAVPTPGHVPDHVAWVVGGLAFTGDAVLGEGSVFLSPDPGALAGYLAGLRRLRALGLTALCPGHGPLVEDPAGKLDEYVAHRLEREAALVSGLAAGARGIEEMLDAAWADVPAVLRPAAEVTLAAHLDKLADEGRLPAEVERPARPAWLS